MTISPQLKHYRKRSKDTAFRRKRADREALRRAAMSEEERDAGREYQADYRGRQDPDEKRRKNREYMAKRRAERQGWLYGIKNAPCMDCGGRYPAVCMDFDHRPGTGKRFNIGERFAMVSMSDLRAEVAKCDVVCSNCHRLRTYRELRYGFHSRAKGQN